MTSIAYVSEAIRTILTERATALERPTGFVERRSARLSGAVFAQTLVFGFLTFPQASYAQLQHVAASLGVPVSRQAVQQRFGPASALFMRQLLEAAVAQVIQSDGRVPELFSRFSGLYLQDGTEITLPPALAQQYPGSKKESGCLRVQLRLEYGRGGWQGLWLEPGRQGENSGPAVQTPVPEGAIWETDAGYLNLSRMRHQGQTERFWIIGPRADLAFFESNGLQSTLQELLARQRGNLVDVQVQVGVRERLPVRLVARRLSPEQTRTAQRRAQEVVSTPPKGARRPNVHRGPLRTKSGNRDHHGDRHHARRRTSAKRKDLLGWVIWLTNLPLTLANAEEVLVLGRCRWQSELVWKLGKSLGKLDTWPSEDPERILTEIFAKWLGLLISHWVMLVECWQDPRHSIVGAHQVMQWMAPVLAVSLAGAWSVESAAQRCVLAMRRGCQIQPRPKRPATFQLVEAPTLLSSSP